MSRENVEVVRLAYEAWNRDDIEAALPLIHPDAEWTTGSPDLFPGIRDFYRGHAGVREWWETAKEPWEYFNSHIEREMEEGDIVVMAVRFEAVGGVSGARVEWRTANAFELRGGLIVKFAAYLSLGEALEAVGLRE